MNIKKCKTNEGYTIQMDGQFTFNDNAGFRDILNDFPQVTEKTIVFDMSGVEYIDSAALGMLALANERATQTQKNIMIRGAGGQVLKMLKMARFEQYFTIV